MKPGPKPKSAAELEASGAFAKNPSRRRSDEEEAPEAEPRKIKKPSFLKGVAGKLWDEHSVNADLRTAFDAESFATWCVLQAEFRKDSAHMQTSRLNIKRAYEERFGLNRPRAVKPIEKQADPAEKYFEDDRPGSRLQ